jgi:hypothetical protein
VPTRLPPRTRRPLTARAPLRAPRAPAGPMPCPPPRGPRPWRAPAAALLALAALLAGASLASAGPGLDPLAAEMMLYYSEGPALILTSQAWTLIAPLTEKAYSGGCPLPLPANVKGRRGRRRGTARGCGSLAPCAARRAAPDPALRGTVRHCARARAATPRTRRNQPLLRVLLSNAPRRQGRAVHPGQEPLRLSHARAYMGERRQRWPRRGRRRRAALSALSAARPCASEL